MPNRRGVGRGTRHGKGIQSGSTFTTMPSGVTLSAQGISGSSGVISPTALGNLDSLAGPAIGGVSLSGLMMATNLSHWGGTPVAIATGLSTVLTFTGAYRISPNVAQSQVSDTLGVIWKQDDDAGVVTAAVYANGATGVEIQQTGGSIAWVAMGY